MADRATAVKAGVDGVLFTVVPPPGFQPFDATAVVDYSGFAGAAGADYGSRLRLVELPACVLTTPAVPACQVQKPIAGGRNDASGRKLTADVSVGSGADAFGGSSGHRISLARTDVTASVAATRLVLAATAGTSGTNGDFTATSLSPSGSWSAGGDSGAFTWSYPIAVPPVAAGSAPSVALSYDSAGIDGKTATTNNQPSWIGEGWDYSPGFIERSYRSCSTFTDLPTASQTPDNCWAGQILTLSLNGSSNALVWDPVTQQVKLQSDDGSRVQRLTGANNGALGGEYWKVTTPDGTQYFFGRGGGPGQTTQGGTSSTWTEPVFGAHSGDPCYSSSGFSSSVCTQAWRWNLDYVEDAHGNGTMYYYTPETNYYGKNGSTTGVQYTRGGYLNKIDYGLRDENGSVYGPATPDQVLFTVGERCIPGTPSGNTCADSQFTTSNSSYWPDVPIDQSCASGATCNVNAPTFWSREMLTNITTRYWNGSAYVKVDSYDLGHQFPNGGDPALWLSSITRTGYAADGSSIAMPTITTKGQLLANRVPNYNSLPPMLHWRLTDLFGDTGAVTSISYSTGCSSTTIPSDASTNTSQCMPVYWTPTGYSAPIFDWFDKYVVTKVTTRDPSALTAAEATSYAYVGPAAWHFDDNEVVKPANRTYGQFRGYGEVDVKTGDPDAHEQLTKTATFYYRGMNGDTLPGGKTRSASISNSLGETTTDDYRYLDSPYETDVFNGDGGARVSATLTDYTVAATTATRPRTGLPSLTADLVRTARTRKLTDLATGTYQTATTTSAYDGLGRVIASDASGDNVPEVCTTTAYADNTALWIRDKPSEVIQSQQACPSAGTAQSAVVADTRTFYDGSVTLGQLAGPGNATRTDVLNNTNGAAAAFFTKTSSGYDTSGRVTSSVDALGRTTGTVYTPSDGGVLTQIAVTNPASQTMTTVDNPDRGTIASSTDVAGHVTSATYDALGRMTQLWKPGRVQGTNAPNETYSYLIQTAGPEVVTGNVLVDYGTGTNYVTTAKLSDALGRPIQTQTATEGGGSQVSDTFYDGHGWTVATNDHYLISQAPSNVVQSVPINAVDARTVNTYDGTGRVTLASKYKLGNVTQTTQTIYGGDRTTVIPPTGGVITTTVKDVRGRTSELDQYTVAPTVSGNVVSGGFSQPTTYNYDALGRQTQIASSGSTWTFTLDMLGNKLSQNDPDTGISSTQYDLDNEVTSTTDARGQNLAYTYDILGRKTAEFSGSTTGTKLASWTWDTLQAGKLSNETRYTTTGNYVTGTSSYDGMGNPMAQYVTLPFQETGMKGTWTTGYSYSSTGLQLSIGPAPVAGVPGETITNTYDAFGKPVEVAGTSVTASQNMNGYGLPGQITYGGGASNNVWRSFTYDAQTLKVTDDNVTAQLATPQVNDTQYSYDPSGQITQINDTEGPKGISPVDDQCFTYDSLDRLNAAWSATDACAAAPNNGAGGNIGGPNPYWLSWTFNANGTRASQTTHALPAATGGDTTTNYSYNIGGTHSLAATITSGPNGTTGASYNYDQSGDTSSRPDATGTQNQTLNWDADGRLAKDTAAAGTTTWVYDADGNQTVRHDPGSMTLYLPGQEITRTSNGTISAIRYYSLAGTVVGEFTGQAATTEYLIGDQHSTSQIAINTGTLAVTRRAYDPFGNARGGVTGGTWPDNRGFIDAPSSAATGLSDIGARKYDPVTGRFISVDPQFNSADPQSLAGYTYSDNTPVTNSDPTGLRMICPDEDCGITHPNYGCASDGLGHVCSAAAGAAEATSAFTGGLAGASTKFASYFKSLGESITRDVTALSDGEFQSFMSDFGKFTRLVSSVANSGFAGLAPGGGILNEGSGALAKLSKLANVKSWGGATLFGAGTAVSLWSNYTTDENSRHQSPVKAVEDATVQTAADTVDTYAMTSGGMEAGAEVGLFIGGAPGAVVGAGVGAIAGFGASVFINNGINNFIGDRWDDFSSRVSDVASSAWNGATSVVSNTVSDLNPMNWSL
ncbi:RHS repeat-associated protein [Catenulispora sp. EB89]